MIGVGLLRLYTTSLFIGFVKFIHYRYALFLSLILIPNLSDASGLKRLADPDLAGRKRTFVVTADIQYVKARRSENEFWALLSPFPSG